MPNHLFLFLLFLPGLLTLPVDATLEQRAQSWKLQRVPGSAQLSIEAIRLIVLPTETPEDLSAAIGDFAALLEARTGRAPEIVSEGRPKNALYFELRPTAEELGGAFSIRRERSRVFIRAAAVDGWRNGLYGIAQNMLGARWYWAGDLGFEWVPPRRDQFPRRLWREKPAFVQRQFHPATTDYARRNRLNHVYKFNHNLARVFSAELFEAHPEVFAEFNGRRRLPKGSGGTDPQPNFTEPKTAEVAARAVLDHFEANPESRSFSLSINDNVRFDTGSETEAAVSPLRYFRRRPDYTDLVFAFMNDVAELVFEKGEAWETPSGKKRYLTALAYYWTEPAPSIPLHPRVMPVLTSDRAQWHDPDYRAEDRALIKDWSASGAERIATWDYYFGAPYPYPRQFNQWIAESLRFMSDTGVDVFFSQLPAFWGLDGAKPWLGAQLLWDPLQDAGALLDEYYSEFFGPAGEPMRRFYETAEAHRNEEAGTAEWIKFYKDEAGVALFTEEVLRSMRNHLSEATELAAAESDGERLEPDLPENRFLGRVEVVSRAFQFTELYAAYNRSREALVEACFDGAGRDEITKLLQIFRERREAFESYFDTFFEGDPYAPARRHFEIGQSNPEPLARALLDELSDRKQRSLVADPGLAHQGTTERDFLGPHLPRIEGWNLDYRPSQHFSVEASAWREGGAGLRIEGADMLSVFRRLPVVSNGDYLLKLRAAWCISPDNRIHIQLIWLDRDGKSLGSEVPLRWPAGERDQPTDIHIPLQAPNNAGDLRIRIVTSRQYKGDYLDISEIDFSMMVD